MNLFVRAWKGEASLAAAFWLIHVVFGIVVALIVSLVLSFIIPNLFKPDVYPVYSDLIMTIAFPYTLYSTICVWRCAKNSSMIWAVLARILVVLAIISGIISILHVAHIM